MSSLERMKVKMTPLMVVMMEVLNGGGKSPCVLEEIRFIMFESCLQRPKDVIFERLSERFSYGIS